MANKALAAGKYLNILLTCGTERPEAVDFDLPTAPDSVDVNASEHTRRIERCYDAASRELVRLLWNEYDFMGHLRSLKHFFLMDEVRYSDSLSFCFLFQGSSVLRSCLSAG